MIRQITNAAIPTYGARALAYFCLFLALGAVPLAVAVVASGTSLTVSATSATLTDAASSDAQVIGRVNQGTRLTATGRKSGDWVEIQAPAEVSGWVFGELVRDGVIATSSVKVRSGPGIGYAALGTLVKGTLVVSRGSRGDWLEIAGQPSFVVWVERAMVAERAATDLTESARVVPSPVPAAASQVVKPSPTVEETVSPPVSPPIPVVVPASSVAAAPRRPDVPQVVSPPAILPEPPTARPRPSMPQALQVRQASPPPIHPAPASVRTVRPAGVAARPVPVPPPDMSGGRTSPIGRRLITSAPQGTPVVVSGKLRPVGFALFPVADYRLVSADGDGPAFTLCYVTGADQLFLGRIGQTVTIEGRKYWSVGSREPIVLAYSIR